MAEKLHEYQGFVGRLHGLRDNLKEKLNAWKESHPEGLLKSWKDKFGAPEGPSDVEGGAVCEDFSHIYR